MSFWLLLYFFLVTHYFVSTMRIVETYNVHQETLRNFVKSNKRVMWIKFVKAIYFFFK